MPYSNAATEDESLPPPEASPTRSATTRDVPPPDSASPDTIPYHRHIPYTDPVTGKPTGGNFTDQGQYGQPVIKAYPPVPVSPPATPPTPPESNEPYIPSQTRPYDQWGVPDFSRRGPYMPRPRDFAPLLHRVVMGLGRHGSYYTGMPAIAMGTYANAYWQAYQKGMKERATDNWNKYREARQMTLDRAKEEILKAKEGIALYGNNPDKLKQYYQQMVSDYHDQQLANALAINPAAVDALWGVRDTHWHDLAKQKQVEDERKQLMDIRAAQERRRQEKEKRDAEARKRLDDERRRIDPNAEPAPPGAGADAGSAAEEPIIPPVGNEGSGAGTVPSPDEGAGADEGADAGAPNVADNSPDTPIQTADASGQIPIGRGVESPLETRTRTLEPEGKSETPFLEEAAKGWVFSNKTPASLGKKGMEDLQQRAEDRGAQLKAWLDRLESDPNINPKAISPAIRKVFPSLADKIDGYLSGNRNAPPSSRADPEWKRAIDLASRIDPNFSQGTFQSRQQGLAAWTRGERGNNLSSLGIAMNHALTLLDHLKDKPGGNLPYGGGIAAEISRRFGGKGSRAALLDADIDTFAEEYVKAMSGKGGTIPEIANEKKRLDPSYPADTLSTNVEERIHLLQTKLREKQAQFSSETGFPAQDILRRFKNFAAVDPAATNENKLGATGLEKLDKWTSGSHSGGDVDYKDYFK